MPTFEVRMKAFPERLRQSAFSDPGDNDTGVPFVRRPNKRESCSTGQIARNLLCGTCLVDENDAFIILAADTCMQNMSRERLVRDHIHAC